MKGIPQLLKDRRYVIFYAFTAITIAVLLAIEELIDGDYERTEEVVLEFITDIPVFFLLCLVIGYLAGQIIKWLDKHYSWEERSFKRLIYEVISVLLLVTFFTAISVVSDMMFIVEEVGNDDEAKYQVLTLLMFFIGVFMVFSFHEYISLNEDKKVITDVAKDLERQNYISKYEALRNQVNPHFLFNSLNVLSSLIYSDIALSDKFIRKFSEVFRYVLELNDEELVPLKREIDFIQSFFFLQKIRYEECVKLSMNIRSEDLDALIPPMALQIVVENAFKHNVISNSCPLHIQLCTSDGMMKVKNNYQARTSEISSTGIGQRNLIDRYKILSDKLPEFYIEEEHYVAELPLLENNPIGHGSSNR